MINLKYTNKRPILDPSHSRVDYGRGHTGNIKADQEGTLKLRRILYREHKFGMSACVLNKQGVTVHRYMLFDSLH